MDQIQLPEDVQQILKSKAEKRTLISWDVCQDSPGQVVVRLVFEEGMSVKKERKLVPCDKFTSVSDYENFCQHHMDRVAWCYFSNSKCPRDFNKKAFDEIFIQPKYMTNSSYPVTERKIKVTGETVSFPVGISPTALHQWVTSDGELATVRAAKKADVIYVASIHSNTTLEDIAKAEPTAMRWQQMYLTPNKVFVMEMLERAKKAGVTCIVLTVDRNADLRKKGHIEYHIPSVLNLKQANLSDSQFRCSHMPMDTSWDDVAWFCQQSTLPVLLKGILTPEGARMAVTVGAKGIIVSSHGGRLSAGFPAPIDVLRSVVDAVDGKLEVFMDGGIRTGLDVFKALAYGARMVFIGRPAIWGLSHSGQAGLQNVLNILKDELTETMMRAGTPTLDDITMDRIYTKPN